MQIIVLEDKEEYISYNTEEETKAQDRRPFDLLVCMFPYMMCESENE
jgi:peptide deformylase